MAECFAVSFLFCRKHFSWNKNANALQKAKNANALQNVSGSPGRFVEVCVKQTQTCLFGIEKKMQECLEQEKACQVERGFV